MKRRSSTEASEKDQAKRVSDLFVCKGVPDHIRSDNGKPRDELLQRQAFDTLLEANGALRAVAAAHQHDPTAHCLGLPAPLGGLVYWRAKS